jgi:outer membrane receptor protein involved in Fe transport
MIRKQLLLASAATAFGVLAAAGTALAEDAPATIDAVVVTANRREQKVEDIPYNISAVSGADIEAKAIVDAPELLRSVPGVAVVDRGYRNSGVTNGVFIRGLNVDGSALGDYAVSGVSTVSTYVDDTPIFANFILKDVERVEVLRGPQGTLYGSGSLGGTVRYITRDPNPAAFSGMVSGGISKVEGSESVGYRTDATLNIPLGDRAALRINGAILDYPGVTDYVNLYVLDSTGAPKAPLGVLNPAAEYRTKKDADSVDIKYLQAALLLEPTDNFKIKASYIHQADDIGGRRQVTRGVDGYGHRYGEYQNGSVQLEPSSRQVDLGSLEATLDLGFATLTSSTSYYDHHGDSVSENTGFYAKAGFLAFYYNYPRPMASAVRQYGDKSWVQELRLVSKAGGPLDYVVGAYYQDQKLLSAQQSYLRGFKRWWDAATGLPALVAGDQDFDYTRKETFKTAAGYGELTWHASDTVQLTGGFRYFSNDSDNDTHIALPLYVGFAPPTDATYSNSDSGWLFKGNASWNFNPDNMLYATVSEGYRRGGSNAVPLTGTFAEDPRWQVYGPDRVTNYEVGIKGTSDRFRYTVTLFRVDWKDIQLNTATPNWGFYVVQNGGKARTQGLEAELQGRLTDELRFNLGYSYVDAKLVEDMFSPVNSVTPIARSGAMLPGTPKNSFNIGLNWTRTLSNGVVWNSWLNGYYQSETRNSIGTSPLFDRTFGGFSIWDASTSLSFDKWDVNLYVKNIFNEPGVTGAYTENYMGTRPSVGYYGNGSKDLIALPRTVGAVLTYRF